jgi:hypothetical protein
MTDTTVAPPSQAPANEVPINPNPTSAPNPVGPQTPQAPAGDVKGSEYRPPSRREALQAAYDRATKMTEAKEKTPQRASPQPAEARKGHNQPPEDTPDEKLDLRKRPSDQPRGERGQFAPRARDSADKSAATNQERGSESSEQSATRQLPSHAPYRDPPPRMAEHAKRDWASTPETVRGEIGRMHEEFGKAYQYYRADHEAFKPLRPYHQMAQSQGTSLERAVHNYVTMEQKLRADPLGGLDLIVHNLGLTDPNTGRRLDLRDVAYTVLSQSPEQLKVMQQGNQQNAAQHQIGALHAEISGLKQHLHQMHTQQQFTQVRSGVDQFADTHPRFDELGDLIEQELKSGYPLDQAYRRAELLRPATHAPQTRNPSAQTRTTVDRSISGSPAVTGSNPAARRSESSKSPREAVQKAIRAMNGSL